MDTVTAFCVLRDQGLISAKAAQTAFTSYTCVHPAPDVPNYTYNPVFTDLVPGAVDAYRLRDATDMPIPPTTQWAIVLEQMLLDRAACNEAISTAPKVPMVFCVGDEMQFTGTYESVLAESALYRESLYLTEKHIYKCTRHHSQIALDECSCRKKIPYDPLRGLGVTLAKIDASLALHHSNAPYSVARIKCTHAVTLATKKAVDAFSTAALASGMCKEGQVQNIVRWPPLWVPRITVPPSSFTLDPLNAKGFVFGGQPVSPDFSWGMPSSTGVTQECADLKDAAHAARAAMYDAIKARENFDKQHLAAALAVFKADPDLVRKLRNLAACPFDSSVAVSRLLMDACELP